MIAAFQMAGFASFS